MGPADPLRSQAHLFPTKYAWSRGFFFKACVFYWGSLLFYKVGALLICEPPVSPALALHPQSPSILGSRMGFGFDSTSQRDGEKHK